MDAMLSLFQQIEPWHWLVLALILLGIEMAIGTYDLLWISGAAFLTAAFAAIPLPAPLSGWEAEAVAFAVASIALLIAGRTVFSGLRSFGPSDRPLLNQRGQSVVGASAVVAVDFVHGEGRVKLGDTTWSARSPDGSDLQQEQIVRVRDVQGTILIVEAMG